MDDLGSFVANMTFESIPTDVISHSKLVILDTLGVILAASVQPEPTRLAVLMVSAEPCRAATVLRRGFPEASAACAAFLNGSTGVFLEMDEGHRFYATHGAMHVVPAALAVAEQQGSSGRDLLTAVIVGYDAAARTGGATRMRPEIHGHGTWGTLGAAAASAKLLRLTPDETTRALRLAAHLAVASSFRTAIEGASVRNAYVGMAGQSGIRAAQLAQAGFTGLADASNEVFGRILGTAFNDEVITEELGHRFEITRNFFKMYACCQWNHAALDAVEQLLSEQPVRASEIDRIHVRTYSPACRMTAPAPVSPLQAKFSIPYAIAARLVFGNVGPDVFDQAALHDAGVLAIAKRVQVSEDPQMSKLYPLGRPAEVSLRFRDGSERTARCDNARGDFVRPFPQEELEGKFRSLARRVLTERAADEVSRLVHHLDELQCIAQLISVFREGERLSNTA